MWRLVVVLALVLGWLTGGSLRNVAEFQVWGLWAVFVSAGLKLAVTFADYLGPVAEAAGLLHLLAYVLLFWALWVNRRVPGMMLIGVGSLLNFLAIVSNGGKMPVAQQALIGVGEPQSAVLLGADRSFTHTLVGEGTRLTTLGDNYPFPDLLYIFPHTVFSIGDAVMAVGIIVFILALMHPPVYDK